MARMFQLDMKTTIQAVAFLLRKEQSCHMNYMRLLKILYLVEREVLAESGKPLTGSRVIAMERGPVLEDIYSLIRNQHIGTPEWATFFRVNGYFLEMIADPGVGRLSRFVSNKLDEISVRHVNDDEFAMVDFTHKLPEWLKNYPGMSSKEIPLSDILEAVGRPDDLDDIVAGAKEDARAADFFSGAARTESPAM